MTIQAGTTLGDYEIVAPLGAGGMGEVYRARDPRLGREVAIKILPPAFAGNEDRLRRFTEEARAAGVLNHPNLLTIHDLGTHAGIPFIVSELLEGETLRERLRRGPLPQRKAIDYALQIGSGLAAAHEKGIIHRDLKPENILITTEERIKLLDFGLAKLISVVPSDQERTIERVTDPGIIVGTAAYMSPEQVRGHPLDQRSDIFSFGTVLFEMLTGKQAFRRDSQIDTMNAILHEEQSFPPGSVNSFLERVILHALEKNPAQRFQSVKDMAFDLTTISGSGEAQPVAATRRRSEKRIEKKMLAYQSVTYRRGFVMSARFMRDGSVIYGAAWEDKPLELFSSIPGDPQARTLGVSEADVLGVSPTTGELAISLGRHFTGGWMTSGTLARLSLGGSPREICEDMSNADWSPDGTKLAITRRTGDVYTIEYPLGRRIYETPHWLSHLRVSPKGDLIAFLDHPLWYDDGGRVLVIDLQGQIKLQSSSWGSTSGLAWTPKGDEVWVAAEELLTGRGLVGLSLTGKERSMLPVPGRLTLHDISRNGDVLVTYDYGRREMIGGKKGAPGERNLSWFDWTYPTAISGDGSRIVFEEHGRSSRTAQLPGAYLRKTDGTPAVHLGQGRVRGFSPDGKWIAMRPDDKADYFELMPTGVGESRQAACHGLEVFAWWYWFPDSKRLLVWGNEEGRSNRMYEVLIDGDGTPRPIGPEGTEVPIAISPDGREVVATAPDQRLLIYAVENDHEPREVPSSRRGDQALLWGADGAIYVYQVGRLEVAIERIDLNTGERTRWHEVQPADKAGVMVIQPLLLAADRESYVYGYRRLLCELYVVKGLV